ncbi:hypothetical protein [Sphingobacterium sp.]|uniref:hypothetical protein n=1 Tax=Sphingobacterium sp. TaxID=341027 RepID=UPI0028A8E9CC|nr:hypothetical protein [Sphingobacterium sp.]
MEAAPSSRTLRSGQQKELNIYSRGTETPHRAHPMHGQADMDKVGKREANKDREHQAA